MLADIHILDTHRAMTRPRLHHQAAFLDHRAFHARRRELAERAINRFYTLWETALENILSPSPVQLYMYFF